MNISPKNQSQFELFPDPKVKHENKRKKVYLFKDLTLSQENIIVLCIIFIMIIVLFYSFGVESGKKVVKSTVIQEQTIPKKEDKIEKVVLSVDAPKMEVQEKQNVLKFEVEKKEILKDEKVIKIPLEELNLEENLYTIQVASFKRKDNAEKEAKGLEKIGQEIFVLPKGDYSIVCVGKFKQRIDAKEFSGKLKDRYTDCLVRRL